MTAYTSARRRDRYDRTIASGLAPCLKASSTNSRSTRELPTRKTPGGASRNGTATVSGSKSMVVIIIIFLSASYPDCTLSRPVPVESRFHAPASLHLRRASGTGWQVGPGIGHTRHSTPVSLAGDAAACDSQGCPVEFLTRPCFGKEMFRHFLVRRAWRVDGRPRSGG